MNDREETANVNGSNKEFETENVNCADFNERIEEQITKEENEEEVEENTEESLMRAMADLELLTAAYPDEITLHHTANPLQNSNNSNESALEPLPRNFPLVFTLHLSSSNPLTKKNPSITMQLSHGYPTTSGITVTSYRIGSSSKLHVENVVSAIHAASVQSLGEESALLCCAAAMEAWQQAANLQNHALEDENTSLPDTPVSTKPINQQPSSFGLWITGEPLMDRKSTFQAHLCSIASELDVPRALDALIGTSGKLQRATHNMYAYRLFEKQNNDKTTILKHDNNDDGEDGAGSRLAHLLQMRNETNVLLVVSRWYGGILLGPKRFAHISNVARELLVQCHDRGVL